MEDFLSQYMKTHYEQLRRLATTCSDLEFANKFHELIVSEYTKYAVDYYTKLLAGARTEDDISVLLMSVPEEFRTQVYYNFKYGGSGRPNPYPPYEILSYSSLDSMLRDLTTHSLVGKKWSASKWGQMEDLSYYEEKGDMLKEWIRLIKMLKTLRDNTSSYRYSIKMKTDLPGSNLNDTSYILEVVGSNITLHTNCPYYRPNGEKVRVEAEVNKKDVLEQLYSDTLCILEDITGHYFAWNRENGDCPSARLATIYKECTEIANKQ